MIRFNRYCRFQLCWMGLSEKLSWGLTVCFDHCLQCLPLDWVLFCVDIDTKIRQRMENVYCFYSFSSSLLVPKDQVNPVMQISRNLGALQRLTMNKDKHSAIISTPRWQSHMMYQLAVLSLSEIKAFIVNFNQSHQFSLHTYVQPDGTRYFLV